MKIAAVAEYLESIAPPGLQENYDNSGLLTGHPAWECTGIVVALDATEEVVMEAVKNNCNLVVAHHPIIFSGLKKITGSNYVERAVISAIKNDICIYAIHTNLDNILNGVNGAMADRLGLLNRTLLSPKKQLLKKLYTFVPVRFADEVRNALFKAGAGHISDYSECSFNTTGTGTFKPGIGTTPFSGKIGERREEKEIRIEAVYPGYLEAKIINALREAHPYEEVAFDLVALENIYNGVGSGLVGDLLEPMEEAEFFIRVREIFGLPVIRHTQLTGKKIGRVALCGGAGSFLIGAAGASGAQIFLTADIKYHEFFDADNRFVLADIGHFESEQFTISYLFDILTLKFPNFAVRKTGVKTNPVLYFL